MGSEAHGGTPGTTGALVGREAQTAVLHSALDAAARAGSALVVRGDPGVGKTALLDRAAEDARRRGMRVLRAVGTEAEATLAFAALHQAVHPLLGHESALAPAQRLALARAFGAADGATPDAFAVRTAVLGLLRAESRETPVLLLVDDAQWIDTSSAQVLGFVQRRVAALLVVVVSAVRTGRPDPLGPSGGRVLDVAPLTRTQAAALLERAHPGLAGPTARRVLNEAAGNPLALLELPARLDAGQRHGTVPLPRQLPLGDRLEAVFAGRAGTLPEATQAALLLAALVGDAPGGLDAVRTAARSGQGDDLAPAVEEGLVTLDPHEGRIAFRHPLVRSSLIRATAPAARRAAHRALADALAGHPERRALHLAGAAEGPDEAAARALEHAAALAERRGGAAEATTALSRAAELSPAPLERVRRGIEAALMAVLGGRLETAEDLLRSLGSVALPARLAVRRATAAAHLMLQRGDAVDTVHRTLTPLLDRVPPADGPDPVVEDALFVLTLAGMASAGPELWEPVERALDRASAQARLCHDASADPARTARTVGRRLREAVTDLRPEVPLWQARWLVTAAVHVDAFADFTHLWRGLEDRSSYALRQLITVSSLYDGYLHGRWDEVAVAAEEGMDHAGLRGDQFMRHLMHYDAALVAAARGESERLAELNTRLASWVRPRGMRLLLGMVAETDGRAALARGAHEEAYAHLSSFAPPGELPPHSPYYHRVFLDLVEACTRTGRHGQARAHVAAGRRAGMAEVSQHHALVLAASEALAAGDGDADGLFREALTLPGVEQWPFDQARIQLAYGEWLRRRRERAAARVHLTRALTTLTRLGAAPWAQRAAEELRVVGASPGMGGGDLPALTAQELRIAELAARGMSNKEIGRALHVSPRTVGAHLYKVFPKLGVASRGGLRDALQRAGVQAPVGAAARTVQ